MLRTDEILSTIQMLHSEDLDVRTVTLALNVDDCAAPSMDLLCRKLREKILGRASRLVEVCDRIRRKYGIPIVNKRLAITPVSHLVAGCPALGEIDLNPVLVHPQGATVVDVSATAWNAGT